MKYRWKLRTLYHFQLSGNKNKLKKNKNMLYGHTIGLMTNHFNMHTILIAGLKLPNDWAIARKQQHFRGWADMVKWRSNNNNNDNLSHVSQLINFCAILIGRIMAWNCSCWGSEHPIDRQQLPLATLSSLFKLNIIKIFDTTLPYILRATQELFPLFMVRATL